MYVLEYCKSCCDNGVTINSHLAAYLGCQRPDANVHSHLWFPSHALPTLFMHWGFPPKVKAYVIRAKLLSFLSLVLQDRGGYSLAFWGGQSSYKGFTSPASLTCTHCYFTVEAGRVHTAFGRMVSFSFLQKKSQGAHQISLTALTAFPLTTVGIWIPLYVPMFWSVISTSPLQTGSILKQVRWFGNCKCVPSISESSGQNENLSLHLKEFNML